MGQAPRNTNGAKPASVEQMLMFNTRVIYNGMGNEISNILFRRLPTGSQGASPKAHFSWRVRYRLSIRAASRLASDIADFGVVALGASDDGSDAGEDGEADVAALLVVAPLTKLIRAINATQAIRLV